MERNLLATVAMTKSRRERSTMNITDASSTQTLSTSKLTEEEIDVIKNIRFNNLNIKLFNNEKHLQEIKDSKE